MRDAFFFFPRRLRILANLTKAPITFAVLFATGAGYLLAAQAGPVDALVPLLGTFLLAAGACALNQVQDARLDARMERTKQRPIPSGRLSRSTAFFIGMLLALLGLYCLASATHHPMTLLKFGCIAWFWYNGVYTYLRRITAFAVVPGALIGAFPPLIGWTAAGGDPRAPLILLVAAFWFIWQIPHFWLLHVRCAEEYQAAGLPALTAVFSPRQIARIAAVWMLAVASAGMALPALAGAEFAMGWRLTMLGASIWLASRVAGFLRRADTEPHAAYRRAFHHINLHALIIMLALALSAV